VSATFDPARSAALEKPTSVHILSPPLVPEPRRPVRTSLPPSLPPLVGVNASRLSMIASRVCVQGAVCATDLAGPFLGQPVFHVIFASCLTPPGLTFFLARAPTRNPDLDMRGRAIVTDRSRRRSRRRSSFSSRAFRHRRDCCPPLHLASGSPSNLRRIYVIQGFRWNDEIAEICASGCDRCRYSREMRALIQLRLNRRVWILRSPWKDRSMIDSKIALCSARFIRRGMRDARDDPTN